MSDYGFEKGTVSIPTKEWKTFRDNVYSKYNARLQWGLEKALEFHKIISLQKKGKRNFDYSKAIYDLLEREFRDNTSGTQEFMCNQIRSSLFDEKTKKFKKPTKKEFAPLKATKDLALDDSSLCVVFDNKTKTIRYGTDDNNHSVDNARNSYLGKTIFSLLDRVRFTSKTGGYFKFQSEYNEDSDGFTEGRVSFVYGKYVTNKKLNKELMRR